MAVEEALQRSTVSAMVERNQVRLPPNPGIMGGGGGGGLLGAVAGDGGGVTAMKKGGGAGMGVAGRQFASISVMSSDRSVRMPSSDADSSLSRRSLPVGRESVCGERDDLMCCCKPCRL